MDAERPAVYESPAARAWIAIIVLALIVVADVVAIVSDVSEVRLLQRAQTERISFEEADANDVRQAAISAVQLVLFIGARGVLHRVAQPDVPQRRRDRAAGAALRGVVDDRRVVRPDLEPVPAVPARRRRAALGGAARRLGARAPRGLGGSSGSASLVLHNVSFTESGQNDTLDEAIAGSKWLAAADVADAVAAGLALAVVVVLTRAQEARAGR